MLVTVYRLRSIGKPRPYRAVLAAPRPHGLLVFGADRGPARMAEVLIGGKVLARLLHAEVVRVSNGCLLLQGREDGHAQAWLCALDERAGEAALRKIRPPTAADIPFAEFEDDECPLDRLTGRTWPAPE